MARAPKVAVHTARTVLEEAIRRNREVEVLMNDGKNLHVGKAHLSWSKGGHAVIRMTGNRHIPLKFVDSIHVA